MGSVQEHTYYGLDAQRGGPAHDRMGILPFFKGIAHHDALAAYNIFTKAKHSFCNAHVLRELNGVIDREDKGPPSQWALEMKHLLKSAKTPC